MSVLELFLKCDALHDLVPFLQFKKREKHQWRSVNFRKLTLLDCFFFTFFKLYKQYKIAQRTTNKLAKYIYDLIPPIRHSFRNANSFAAFPCRTQYFKNFFFPCVMNDWNKGEGQSFFLFCTLLMSAYFSDPTISTQKNSFTLFM